MMDETSLPIWGVLLIVAALIIPAYFIFVMVFLPRLRTSIRGYSNKAPDRLICYAGQIIMYLENTRLLAMYKRWRDARDLRLHTKRAAKRPRGEKNWRRIMFVGTLNGMSGDRNITGLALAIDRWQRRVSARRVWEIWSSMRILKTWRQLRE